MNEVCECGTPLATHPPLRRPAPLRSWKALRPVTARFGTITERRWSEVEFMSRVQANDRRRTDRMDEVIRIVEKHGGNRHAAARELGITSATVFATLKRAGL